MADEYNAGDEVQVKKRKTKDQLRSEQYEEDMKTVLNTVPGRHILWKLLSNCKVFNTMYAPDPHEMAILCGRRDVGAELLAQIMNISPSFLTIMADEAKEREK